MRYSKHHTVSPLGTDLRLPEGAIIVKVDEQYGAWHVWYLMPMGDDA